MSLLYSSAHSESTHDFAWSPQVTPLPYPLMADLNKSSIEKTQLKIRQLVNLKDDWDGFDSPPPSAVAITNADRHAALLMTPLLTLKEFFAPHISASSDAEVTFEWWKDHRKLTLYFADNSIEYLKSWGTDLDNEMEHDNFRGEDFQRLFFWLING